MPRVRASPRNERAVSPIIAVLLMVAITVVLASVVYLTVSNMMLEPGEMPQPIGVSITKTGLNWSITFVSAPPGLYSSSVYLIVRSPNGTTIFQKTHLSNMTQFQDVGNNGFVEVGDAILLPVRDFPPESKILIMGEQTIMYSGELPRI